MTFTRVGVIVIITAVAVYFGLNVLLPRHAAEQKAGATTTPDQVFSSNSDATPVAPADNTAAAATPTPSADQQAAGSSSSSAAPASSDTTPPPAAAAATETASGGSSSASAPAAAAAPAQGLSEEEARKIAEEVGRKVATQVASSVVQDKQQPQAATESAPAANSNEASSAASSSSSSGSSDQAAPAAASPAATAEPAAAPEAAPAAAPTPAAEPAPKKSKHTKVAVSDSSGSGAPAKPAKSHSGQQSMDAISVWWPAVEKQSDSKLNLVYAGEAAFDKAVVLLFSDNIGNIASASSHIKILDSHGSPASGQWTGSPQNARMLIFKTTPGRYTVVLAPDLAGLSGKTLGTGLHGPVYIH